MAWVWTHVAQAQETGNLLGDAPQEPRKLRFVSGSERPAEASGGRAAPREPVASEKPDRVEETHADDPPPASSR